MKLIALLAFLFLTGQTSGQNIVLPGGEYMDTASGQNTICPNYNAYYYQVGGKYPENPASVLKELKAFRQNNNNVYSGSGYITFRFTVDCEGKVMQKVQVMQTDDQYRLYHFDRKLVHELFSFFNTMKKWKLATTKQGAPLSYIAFIAFKIENGKVVNIIP